MEITDINLQQGVWFFPSTFFPKVWQYLFVRSNQLRCPIPVQLIRKPYIMSTGHGAECLITHRKPYPFPIPLKRNNHRRAWELARVIMSFDSSHCFTIFISGVACVTAHQLAAFHKVRPVNHTYSSEDISISPAKFPWVRQLWRTETPWRVRCAPEEFLIDCQRVNVKCKAPRSISSWLVFMCHLLFGLDEVIKILSWEDFPHVF